MQEEKYPLKSMLDALSSRKNAKVQKRLIYDQSALSGIGSKWVIAFFISLPFILYAGIFNPVVFAMLGIAQAIIFFVVFLSMLMIMIIALSFINNNKVIRQMRPSWEQYFPKVDLDLVLSSASTPYKDFFKYYGAAVSEGVKDDKLHAFFQDAFAKMEEENKDLLEAMKRSKDA